MSNITPSTTATTAASAGEMWIDRRFERRLHEAGLRRFEDVMGFYDGRCMREMKSRENWYLPPEDDAIGQPATAEPCRADRADNEDQPAPASGLYLKKHFLRTWRSRLRAWLGFGPGDSPAQVEAQNVIHLTASGIQVMHVVAYGQKLHADGLLESFLLTEELHGYEDLTTFLARRFPLPPGDRITRRDPRMKLLVEEVASIAAKFHACGFNHRDFYCCHFFVKEPAAGELDLRLIDLQRIQRRRWFRRRWLVKDLAQLAWSVPRDRVKSTHRLAFIKHYLGVRRLRPQDKRLIRAILGKLYAMERRLGAPK